MTNQPLMMDRQPLVDEIPATDWYTLLLRPEISGDFVSEQVFRVVEHFRGTIAFVPAGRVWVGKLAEDAKRISQSEAVEEEVVLPGLGEVSADYLDRFAVTNDQFQQFVDANGNGQFGYWPAEAHVTTLLKDCWSHFPATKVLSVPSSGRAGIVSFTVSGSTCRCGSNHTTSLSRLVG